MRSQQFSIGFALYFVIGLLLFSYPSKSHSMPASPNFIELQQPDGTKIKARQWGDERSHGWETATGHSIVQDQKNKNWMYATHDNDGKLVSSPIPVTKSNAPSGIEKKLRPSTLSPAKVINKKTSSRSQSAPMLTPSVGETKSLPVILIGFSDTPFRKTKDDFDNLLFGDIGNTMKNYYLENSYNKLTVNGGTNGVYGPLTADKDWMYYGENDGFGYDKYPGTLAYEAVSKAAAGGFKFAPYVVDQSKSCYVDVVMIAHQGTGEEAGFYENDIWSHSWNLNEANSYESYKTGDGEFVTDEDCSSGGKIKINNYVIQPELATPDPDNRLVGFGVFAHEYGHALGLPDLYDTVGNSDGAGNWSLMASGSWLGPIVEYGGEYWRFGESPSHLDPWSKFYLGWITPTNISGDSSVSIAAASSATPDFYSLGTGTPTTGEYLLVENRQKSGFDTYLDGAGLLVWHIDGKTISSRANDNEINGYPCTSTTPGACSSYSKHYGVSLIQADNLLHLEKGTNRGDAKDPFVSPKSLADSTTPNSKFWSGSATGWSVTDISSSQPTMTALLSIKGIINGACGSYIQPFGSAPTDDLCSAGTASEVSSGSGPWSWTCSGINGGTTATCTTGTSILTERFTSCETPTDWIVKDNINVTSKGVWAFDNPSTSPFSARGNGTGGTGCFAVADSDWAGEVNMDTELITPSYDFSSYSSVGLSFKTHYRYYDGGDRTDVDISIDGGPWKNMWTYTGSSIENTVYTKTENIDVSTDVAGKSNVKIRFYYYNANYDYWWQVDDVVLYEIPPSTPTVIGISATSGTILGGTSVTITGTNFLGATSVMFGTSAASFTVDSSTQITATSPAGTGTVDITVVTAGGTSSTSPEDQFTYVVPTYTVTYNANGSTLGAKPSDQIKTHGVDLLVAENSGGLEKTGFTFSGWNTAADGSGTDAKADGTSNYSGNADLTLYAKYPTWSLPTAGGSGSILTFAIDPASSLIMYAGTYAGKILKSEDKGLNWSEVSTTGLPALPIFSLVIDPTNSQIMYAALGTDKIYKTTDGGANWSGFNTNIPDTSVGNLAIASGTPVTIYAGTDGAGVFKTTDGGENWIAARSGLPLNVWTLAVNPTIPTILYAGVDNNGGGRNGGIYISTDGGANWSLKGLSGAGILSIAVDPSNPLTIYVGQSFGKVSKSIDGGDNWNTFSVATGKAVSALAPISSQLVYAGIEEAGVFKSVDGGKTWKADNSGIPEINPSINALAINPSNSQNIFAGTSASVYLGRAPIYTVTFNANGSTSGTKPSNQAKIEGIDLTLAANTGTLAKAGYTFSGWNTASDGSGTTYTVEETYSIDAALTLYAKWTALPNKTVTFNSNYGTNITSTQSTNVATNLTTNTFTRPGYSFGGWNTSSVGGGVSYADGASYPFTEDITLYAQWIALPTYSVTYHTNNATSGTAPGVQTKTQGINLTLAANTGTLAKTGYTFAGWNTAADGTGTNYAANGTYSGNAALILYAKWTALPTYTVSYNANGATTGTAPGDQSKIQGINLILAANSGNLVKTWYTFAGWNTAANGTGTNYAAGATYSGNTALTLYAKWTPTDTTGPNLTVSTLDNGAKTNNATLNVAGTASDSESGVKSLTINGTPATITSGSFTVAITLADGANTITTIATNNSGVKTTDTRTITLDQTAPVLAITLPSDNSVTDKTFVEVTGYDNDVTSTVTAKVNNGTATGVTMSGIDFSVTLNLISGLNTIDITATDPAGNSSSVKRTITSDTTAPTLAVTVPVQDITTTQGSMTIRGTVTDLTTTTISIAVGDQTFTPTVTNGGFSQNITLPTEKTYNVIVTATDQVGKTATVQRNIIKSSGSASGDINGDGTVDIVDALRALRIAVGLDTPTAADYATADVAPLVNGKPAPDGVIDIADATVILMKVAGLRSW